MLTALRLLLTERRPNDTQRRLAVPPDLYRHPAPRIAPRNWTEDRLPPNSTLWLLEFAQSSPMPLRRTTARALPNLRKPSSLAAPTPDLRNPRMPFLDTSPRPPSRCPTRPSSLPTPAAPESVPLTRPPLPPRNPSTLPPLPSPPRSDHSPNHDGPHPAARGTAPSRTPYSGRCPRHSAVRHFWLWRAEASSRAGREFGGYSTCRPWGPCERSATTRIYARSTGSSPLVGSRARSL